MKDWIFCGNDTIDCYPLGKGEVKKILVVSEQKFKELQNEFKLFFKGLKGGSEQLGCGSEQLGCRNSQRSSPLEAKSEQILKPPEPLKGSASKFNSRDPTRRFRDYEPTPAISCNNSDWRRWIRVQEWFSQYAQGAAEQILQKEIFIP